MMEKMLIEEFSTRGILRAGELYLRPEVAADYVRSCDKSDMAVVGVEAFTMEGPAIRPCLDLIFDCSDATAPEWGELKTLCNRSALAFLERLFSQEVVVSVEALSKDEWWNS